MRTAPERRDAILQQAQLRGIVRVAELARKLGVSAVTVRRDVTALADAGLLERVHGGATLRADLKLAGRPRRRAMRATVGMVVPSATYYYPAVIRGAQAAAMATGARIVLAISHYHPEEERDQVARLLETGVHGLLLSTSQPPDTDPGTAAWVAGLSLPTVLIERVGGPGARHLDYIRTDHAAGARLAVEHLAAAGHRTIALAAREDSPTTRWLIGGYRQAVDALGLSSGGVEPTLLPGFDDVRLRTQHLAELLDQYRDGGVSAVLVHIDEDAMGFTQAARERGLAVPGDLAVVAYDDEVAALAEVPLTAIAPPKHDVGATAVDLLLRRLAGGDSPATQHVSLLPRLAVRASCGTTEQARRAPRRGA